jgi:hypothetical protein
LLLTALFASAARLSTGKKINIEAHIKTKTKIFPFIVSPSARKIYARKRRADLYRNNWRIVKARNLKLNNDEFR